MWTAGFVRLMLLSACLASFLLVVSGLRLKQPFRTNYHTVLEERYKLGLSVRPTLSGNVNSWTMEQPLDHFDRSNRATYNQSYWTNEQFFDAQNPVGFIFLGGEWLESFETLEYGANVMSSWAKQFSGLMVNIQHRYYDGKNPPAEEGDAAQVKYLSSTQALADAARIIAHVNEKYSHNITKPIKWISVSGSYGGNLAAWFRLKYPELTVGTVAISAPIQAQVDYTGFFTVQGRNLYPGCLNFIRTAVAELDKYLDDPSDGWKKVQTDFNIVFETKLDVALFAFDLAWGELNDGGICVLQNTTKVTPYQTLAQVFAGGGRRYNYTAESVWQLYSWLWYVQTCREFGYYQTGTDFNRNPHQIVSRHLNPSLFVQACSDALGSSPANVEENIAWTNVNYGGQSITTTNTFFTNGNDDGWSFAGINSGPVPVTGNQFFVIDKGTHCSDLYWASNRDSESLKEARQAQVNAIKQWLLQ